MAFLDNSGDIILDAVLTDTGRYRLAKGDGSFKIAKFALGDDEIDYALYDRDNPSGSAYYDLSILQTPILEAFADNAASMKSKLISIPRTNLLYLPVMKINDIKEPSTALHPSGAFFVAVDKETEDELIGANNTGILAGETLKGGNYIRIDQGLDTTEITPSVTIDSDLRETQYIVEIDNRLGRLANPVSENSVDASVSFIDDDNMASYYFTQGTDLDYVKNNTEDERLNSEVIDGPRGTYIQFKIRSSLELNTSDFLFERLGNQTTIVGNTGTNTIYKIDTIVRVTGATTGYRLDIPVRFVKLVS